MAFIIPVPKVALPQAITDFRPISILCSLYKCLEKIVVKQLTSYLINNNLFDEYQSGFRQGYSTQTALLRITDDIREAIDKRQVTILVFLISVKRLTV